VTNRSRLNVRHVSSQFSNGCCLPLASNSENVKSLSADFSSSSGYIVMINSMSASPALTLSYCSLSSTTAIRTSLFFTVSDTCSGGSVGYTGTLPPPMLAGEKSVIPHTGLLLDKMPLYRPDRYRVGQNQTPHKIFFPKTPRTSYA